MSLYGASLIFFADSRGVLVGGYRCSSPWLVADNYSSALLSFYLIIHFFHSPKHENPLPPVLHGDPAASLKKAVPFTS